MLPCRRAAGRLVPRCGCFDDWALIVAENEGKKEEEKFEFTPEGEALGYISLDQARILAMRTAREAPGDYGRRFRNVPMAFEGVEANETEDFYEVTLAFRPQGAFTGTQGQEQFFIEKEGNVAVRQVLSLPEVAGGRRFPVIPVIIGLLVVGAVAVSGVVAVIAFGGKGSDESPLAAVAPTSTLVGSPTPPSAPTSLPAGVVSPTDTASVVPTPTPLRTATATPEPPFTPAPSPAAATPTPVAMVATATPQPYSHRANRNANHFSRPYSHAYSNTPSHTHSQTCPYFDAPTRTPSRILRRNPVQPLVVF